jgi:hypothetical protein
MGKYVKYRKDLPARTFQILYEFRQGLTTLEKRGQVRVYDFIAADNVLWPQWFRYGRENFDFGILRPRKEEEVLGISRADLRRVCDYKYLDTGRVLQALFMLSMLGVRDVEPNGDRFKLKCRWELKVGSCFIIEADRIYREQVKKTDKRR